MLVFDKRVSSLTVSYVIKAKSRIMRKSAI